MRDSRGLKFGLRSFSFWNEWLKVGHCGVFFISSSFCAVWVVSWLGKRSLFMVTDDQSPVQSIRLVLIFSQRRQKKRWLLPCFCVAGTGLCQPRLQWPHLPSGPWLSPRKELKNFSVPLQPVQELGFPGRSDAFLSPLSLTSLEQQWMWLPGSTWEDALGSACSASQAPSTTESLGRAPSGSFIRC